MKLARGVSGSCVYGQNMGGRVLGHLGPVCALCVAGRAAGRQPATYLLYPVSWSPPGSPLTRYSLLLARSSTKDEHNEL